MGIRGLAHILKQFASKEELHGRVVIDGPALAYHILLVARLTISSRNVSTILTDPTYSVLAATAIQWLDSLQSHGLEVAAIYFDGSLPPSKKEVRHGRICDKSREAHKYFLDTISGIKDEGQVRNRFIPDPPFLVPAILEALRSQEEYSNLVSLVPGEADPYCANDVKQNGGILLTSDSDLLLYDLGPTGSVVFLKDLQFDNGSATDACAMEGASSISALTSKPSELCRRMSLEPGQLSMLRLGFQIKVYPCHTRKSLPPQSTWAYLDEERTKEFAAFIAEYQGSSNLTSTALDHMSLLDPRISEFVSDWAQNKTSGESETKNDLTVWLPLLVDRWDQPSAWDLGTTIRQLAYSVCQLGQDSNSTVKEYRRTLSIRSAGQAVELLDEFEVLRAIEGLLDYVDRLVEGSTVPKRLQWITICLSLEIGHAAQESKESNALGLWRKAATSAGRLEPGQWDTLHLAAQILGTLYSFRMLQQVLKIWNEGSWSGAASSDQMKRLRELLSSLPNVAQFPAAADMENVFQQLHLAGQLDFLSEAVGVPSIIFEAKGDTSQVLRERRPKAGKRKEKHNRARAAQSQASANPFEALSIGN